MKVQYTTAESVELEAGALASYVAWLGYATVYCLEFKEVPQPPASPVAILNVTGVCSFAERSRAGICVMLVGRDEFGGILWACSLMAQPHDEELKQMLESLLVPPSVLGKTRRIIVRISGGKFRE